MPLPSGSAPEEATAIVAGRAAGRSVARLDAPAGSTDKDRLVAVWAEGERPVLTGDGTLEVVSVPDDRAERREAVRAVVAAAERGVPLWDCAVVVPHAADVELAATALAGAGLRVACRRPDRSPGVTLLARLSECLSPLSGAPFSRRAVVDLLATASLRDVAVSPASGRAAGRGPGGGHVAGPDQWVERTGA